MTGDRRYDDDEVREIFGAAAEAREHAGLPASPSGTGLTLSELQDIGVQVGLSPERIADAARDLDVRRTAPPPRTLLGFPLTVARTVELHRAPTDVEWGRLVAELRDTFGTRGRLGVSGNLREWSNGNLHACIEPTETGYRLRMGTLKSSAVPRTVAGGAILAFALVLSTFLFLTGQADDGVVIVYVLLGLIGGILGSTGLFTLPGWAREREAQMEHIAARARALIPEGDEAG